MPMGCNNEKQSRGEQPSYKTYTYTHPSHPYTAMGTHLGDAAAASASSFSSAPGSHAGGGPSTPLASASTASLGGGDPVTIASQHQRLILELLPFKEPAQFQDWLQYLRGDWQEYCADWLLAHLDEPEPDKAATAQQAREALDKQQSKYLAYHPDKTGWTAQDHAVRFVATAVADSLLRKTWSERDWKKRPLEITRAMYEVLSFQRAREVAQQHQAAQQLRQQHGGGGGGYLQQQDLLGSPPEYDA